MIYLLFMSIFPSAAQSITFAVDLVEPADRSVGYSQNGTSLAEHLHQEKTELFISGLDVDEMIALRAEMHGAPRTVNL